MIDASLENLAGLVRAYQEALRAETAADAAEATAKAVSDATAGDIPQIFGMTPLDVSPEREERALRNMGVHAAAVKQATAATLAREAAEEALLAWAAHAVPEKLEAAR